MHAAEVRLPSICIIRIQAPRFARDPRLFRDTLEVARSTRASAHSSWSTIYPYSDGLIHMGSVLCHVRIRQNPMRPRSAAMARHTPVDNGTGFQP